MKRLLCLCALAISLPVPTLIIAGASPALACDQSVSAAVQSQPGVFEVGGSANAEACDEPVAAHSSGPHLEVLDFPACGIGGESTCHESVPCDHTGHLHDTVLVQPNGNSEPAGQVCVGGQQSPAPTQLTAVQVLKAFRAIPLPTPKLGMSPPDGVTLVNLPTIFYTDATPFVREVRVLGRRVRLEIAPVSYAWSVGQGGSFETSWAGSPYRHGVLPADHPDDYVTWTYADAGRSESARVRVVWGAIWSLDGRPMGRVPGTVEMVSPAATVRVREAQPVLTRS